MKRAFYDSPKNAQASKQEAHRKTNTRTHCSTHPV